MDGGIVFSVIILIFSVVIHEVAHGYAALYLGDTTAKYAGRLTLNPVKHLDPVGSVALPLLLVLINSGFLIGWAKPVPFNPYNLKSRRWGELIVAAAGPASNLFIALVFGIIVRLEGIIGLSAGFIEISVMIILINLVLAIFNLIPIPPLDGSKILFGLFPQLNPLREALERWGFVVLIFFIFFLWKLFFPIIIYLLEIFTGFSF
jgi:Zn-dependent protease